jgi:uncharacterized membrane protein (DUF2068 family)
MKKQTPQQEVTLSAVVLFLISVLNLAYGVMRLAQVLTAWQGWYAIVSGAVFAVLGVLTLKRAKLALIAGMILLGLNLVLNLIVVIQQVQNNRTPTGAVGIMIGLLLLLQLSKGLKAMKVLGAES